MARQYAKACRDCGQQIHMLEQTNGQWRAYDDAEHTRPHECKKKPTGQSPSSGQASIAQQPTVDSGTTKFQQFQPGKPAEGRAFTEAEEQVIRRIVLDELRKMLLPVLEKWQKEKP